MANHTNEILIVRVNGQDYIKGEDFYPSCTDNIKEATRLATLSDAKRFVKTAEKRLKMKDVKLEIVPAIETRDDHFSLVDVQLVQ